MIDQCNLDRYPYFLTSANLILDYTKAEKLLNFEPKITLIKGLTETIKSISNHFNVKHKNLWHIPVKEES